jgi:hypothetical protein
VRSIQEYPGKANVIFAGTERHLFISSDSGAHWSQLKANLPTTRYDDIQIHPRTHDLILATHGRALWILDDASPLAEWTSAIATKKANLFAVPRATLLIYWEDVSNPAHGIYTGENPADGATFTYSLGAPAQHVRFTVRGPDGKIVRELLAPATPGVVQRVVWDLRHAPPPSSAVGRGGGGEEGGGPPPAPTDTIAGGRGGGGGGARARLDLTYALPVPLHDIGLRGPYVAPGIYKATLDVDGDAVSRTFEVRGDPMANLTVVQQKAREAFLMDVQNTQIKNEQLVADLRARRAGAAADEAIRLQALERRLTAGRDAPRGKLSSIASAFNGSGAQQGSMSPPTTQQRRMLAEAKAEIASVEKAAGKKP